MPGLNDRMEAYFKEEEIKQLREFREKAKKDSEVKEIKERKALHWMKCPKCGQDMNEIDLEGIKVDKCPDCLGIFFDNEELEQLLDIKYDQRRSVIHKLFGLK